MRLVLNGQDLGPAGPMFAWKPEPGAARIELRDAAGHVLDAAVVQVRGAP